MALVTKVLAILPWDETTVARLEMDYDDTDLRVRTVRVVNPAPRGLLVTASRTDGSLSYNATAPANQTTEQAISTGAAQRLQLVVDERGRLDGVEYSTAWAVA